MAAHVKNLFCDENYQESRVLSVRSGERLSVEAHVDRVLLKDQRILDNLLKLESSKRVDDYCRGLQTQIAPHMRKIVVDWMLEVCEDQQCQPEVFFLAVNYLDRFLSTVNIKKNQFQLLASVCILLASKFSQVVPITSEQLVIYTDNSVSVEEMRQWEIFTLEMLQWDLSAATASSFLQHFSSQFHVSDKVRRQAESIASMAASEYKFILAKDSVIAGAALAAAVKDDLRCSQQVLAVISNISSLIKSDVNDLLLCLYHMIGDSVTDLISEKKDENRGKHEKDRPTTPDDILNVSQTEIEV